MPRSGRGGGGAPAHRASDASLTSAAKLDGMLLGVPPPSLVAHDHEPGMSVRSQLTFSTVLMARRVRLSYESQGGSSGVGMVKMRWMRPLQAVRKMQRKACSPRSAGGPNSTQQKH